MKIIATTRQAQGTGASRRLRRADKLPGIVYGGNVARRQVARYCLRRQRCGHADRARTQSYFLRLAQGKVPHLDFDDGIGW